MASYQGWQGDKPLFKLNLSKKWIDHCAELGESGMGYQKVSIKVKQNSEARVVNGIVLNCSILETVEAVRDENILEIVLT